MTIENAQDQPDVVDAEESTLTEGLPGTERPETTPEDDAEAVAFLTDILGHAPAGAEEVEPQPEPEPEVEPEPEPELEDDPQTAGWQQRRQGLKAAHKSLQAEHEEVRRFTDALLQTVVEMQGRGTVAPAAPEQPVAPAAPAEPDIDIFEDPQGAMRQQAERIFTEQVAPLKAVISKLLEERQGQHVQNAQQTIAANLTAARLRYEEENPGYHQRAQAFQQGYVSDLMAMGYTQEAASNQMGLEVGQIIQTAIRNGVNPIKALDTFARRYAPAPAAAPRRAPASDRIAAAVAANGSGVVRPGPDPASAEIPLEAVTVDGLRAGGVKPGDIRTMLRKPGGRTQFFDIMRRAEEAEARARR